MHIHQHNLNIPHNISVCISHVSVVFSDKLIILQAGRLFQDVHKQVMSGLSFVSKALTSIKVLKINKN